MNASDTADGDESVPFDVAGEVDRLPHALVRRLDVHAGEDRRLQPGGLDGLGRPPRDARRRHPLVGDDEHHGQPHLAEVEADFVERAHAELERRRAPGEDRLGLVLGSHNLPLPGVVPATLSQAARICEDPNGRRP
jgi:hypothetical protein